mgnify:CR=1 FL=1
MNRIEELTAEPQSTQWNRREVRGLWFFLLETNRRLKKNKTQNILCGYSAYFAALRLALIIFFNGLK